jgi:hypothetical protein
MNVKSQITEFHFLEKMNPKKSKSMSYASLLSPSQNSYWLQIAARMKATDPIFSAYD